MVGDLTDKMPNLPYPRTTEFNPRSPSLINTDQKHMVYQNGSLYIYSDTTGLISSIPFSSPFTTPSQKDLFQATPITANRRNMFFQGMRDNSPYLGYLTRLDTYNETVGVNFPLQRHDPHVLALKKTDTAILMSRPPSPLLFLCPSPC